jgi:AAHS family 4-hydroxybenzoate transporter-like MFS transporter
VSRSPAVNVQTFINEHPFSGVQRFLFAMCFFIVLLDGFDTAASDLSPRHVISP